MSDIEHYVRPEGMPPGNGYSHAAAGAGMDQVVKLTVFLTDLGDLPAFREARDACISVARPPASSLVQVSGLVHPQARVEIEAIAVTALPKRQAASQPTRRRAWPPPVSLSWT